MSSADEPAMPVSETTETICLWTGLTKREHFAGLAMQGLIRHGWQAQETAETAVMFADALLEELEK